ncbi:hypothetical protein FHY09_001240 [Xanthomonas sp. 60]
MKMGRAGHPLAGDPHHLRPADGRRPVRQFTADALGH